MPPSDSRFPPQTPNQICLRRTAFLPLALTLLWLRPLLLGLLLRWAIDYFIPIVLIQITAEHFGEVMTCARNTLMFVSSFFIFTNLPLGKEITHIVPSLSMHHQQLRTVQNNRCLSSLLNLLIGLTTIPSPLSAFTSNLHDSS